MADFVAPQLPAQASEPVWELAWLGAASQWSPVQAPEPAAVAARVVLTTRVPEGLSER